MPPLGPTLLQGLAPYATLAGAGIAACAALVAPFASLWASCTAFSFASTIMLTSMAATVLYGPAPGPGPSDDVRRDEHQDAACSRHTHMCPVAKAAAAAAAVLTGAVGSIKAVAAANAGSCPIARALVALTQRAADAWQRTCSAAPGAAPCPLARMAQNLHRKVTGWADAAVTCSCVQLRAWWLDPRVQHHMRATHTAAVHIAAWLAAAAVSIGAAAAHAWRRVASTASGCAAAARRHLTEHGGCPLAAALHALTAASSTTAPAATTTTTSSSISHGRDQGAAAGSRGGDAPRWGSEGTTLPKKQHSDEESVAELRATMAALRDEVGSLRSALGEQQQQAAAQAAAQRDALAALAAKHASLERCLEALLAARGAEPGGADTGEGHGTAAQAVAGAGAGPAADAAAGPAARSSVGAAAPAGASVDEGALSEGWEDVEA